MSSLPIAISFKNISKSYRQIDAVKNISFEAKQGEVMGFVGPNGAGKSTTINIAVGLVTCSSGTVKIFGHDVKQNFVEAIQHVGYMAEKTILYESLSGKTNLRLVSNLHHKINRKKLDEIVSALNMGDWIDRKVNTYSLGMKRKLGLAAALIGSPRLLLLDEPTNGMDPIVTKHVLNYIKGLAKRKGIAVIFSSHLLTEIEKYCDQIIMINYGNIIAKGSIDKLLLAKHDKVEITFKRRMPSVNFLLNQRTIKNVKELSSHSLYIELASSDTAWLNRFLINSGFEIISSIPIQQTLQDFFIDKVNRK